MKVPDGFFGVTALAEELEISRQAVANNLVNLPDGLQPRAFPAGQRIMYAWPNRQRRKVIAALERVVDFGWALDKQSDVDAWR
jgi:hypothetical protein